MNVFREQRRKRLAERASRMRNRRIPAAASVPLPDDHRHRQRLIDIRRIEKSLERHGQRFIRESTRMSSRPAPRTAGRVRRLCQALAAKEACAKALGTGLRKACSGVTWVSSNLPSGAPTMALTGGAKARLDKILPKGHRRRSTSPSRMDSRSLKPL